MKYNVQARFRVDDDVWPPDQPKTFTPLLLLHFEQQRTKKQANASSKLLHSGNIDLVSSAANKLPIPLKPGICEPLKEVLEDSVVTKELENILARLDSENGVPQFILVEGPPGIGKSVLLQEICYRWGKKTILKTFKFVLLICLRDPAVQRTTSVQALLQLFLKGDSRAQEISAACSEYLRNTGGKELAFLLDGFDELPNDMQKEGLIAAILKREALPECGIVVSSRPHASENLRKSATLMVDILGFTEIEREKFINESVRGPSKAKELNEYLNGRLIIDSLCYVPFNLVMLVYLHKQGIDLPNNPTQLYQLFICLTICRHLAKSGHSLDNTIINLANLPEPCNTVVKQLAKLFFEALSQNKLIFTDDEIKRYCPSIATNQGTANGYGLLQAIRHFGLTGKTMTYNFLHFSIQEFLAAFFVASLPAHEEFKVIQQHFWSGFHANMFVMYTALTKGQRPSFEEFLCGKNKAINEKLLQHHLKIIHIFRCYYEAGNKVAYSMMHKLLAQHGVVDLQHITLSVYDIETLALFLTCSAHKEWWWLNLSCCRIQDRGLHVLHRMLCNSDITISMLWLPHNVLTQSSSAAVGELIIHCKVTELVIDGNPTIGEDCAICDMLTHSMSKLAKLHISNTWMSSNAAINLLNAVAQKNILKELNIHTNRISDEACDAITTVFKNTCLTKFEIAENAISPMVARNIVQTLSLNCNKTMNWLGLPDCSEDDKKAISCMQEEIHKKRIEAGCITKLTITFGQTSSHCFPFPFPMMLM